MHVLVKIDVEGHEVSVARGLLARRSPRSLKSSTSPQADIEWLFERFDVEVYNLGLEALERIDPGTKSWI
jgi:hypothetical protein